MANIKISELPAASAASTSQEFEVNDSGTSKKVTGSQIKSFVKDGLVLTDITDVTASVTELNYVDGVTSSIQTQLNDKFKQRTITGTANQITVTNGDGVAGNPTIAAVVASQAEAEAGTDTTKLMTPQRVAQAIDAQVVIPSGTDWLSDINTTSGSTQTISGLNLTGYKYLFVAFRGVSLDSSVVRDLRLNGVRVAQFGANLNDVIRGGILIYLGDGTFFGSFVNTSTATSGAHSAGASGITSSTTSISASTSGNSFDAGIITIMGLK